MASRVGWGKRSVPESRDLEPADEDLESLKSAATALILAGIVFFSLIGAAYGYDRSTSSNLFPGSRIGGVAVGSLSADGAEAILHNAFVMPLREAVTLKAPEFEAEATPWDMGMRVDVSDAVRDAFATQRSETFVRRLWHRVLGYERNIKLKPIVDDKLFSAFLNKTLEDVNQSPKNAKLEIVKDELKVTPHRLGRRVDKARAEGLVFAALTQNAPVVEIPVDIVEPELMTDDFKQVILISTTTNRLKLYENGEVAKKYGVATGTGGYPTPRGQWYITQKRLNPTWYNPNSDWSRGMPAFIGPGPNNPLGTRALNLNASGIRIHGTPDAGSIGSNASHGCVRMHMREVEELFEIVEVGTPVLVI
ncbi:MAG: L,D-transpeptidase/peptidoglycan binding protein [Actinomycetota bacterium]